MPLLIEQFGVLLRRSAADAAWPGGWPALRAAWAGWPALEGGGLVLLGPPDRAGLDGLLRRLAREGLIFDEEDEGSEVALVGQRSGPLGWVPWLELGHLPSPDGPRVLAARLAGDPGTALVVPEGWRHEGSRSQALGAVPLPPTERPLGWVRGEPQAAVYLDRLTGEEVRQRRRRPDVALVVAAGGARHAVAAEVASAGAEISLGLMHRPAVPQGTGMLFDFGHTWPHRFWMKNTLVPLDMLFVDEAGRVVEVAAGCRPLRLAWCGQGTPSRWVLEVPAGWAAARGVGPGARLTWPGLAAG